MANYPQIEADNCAPLSEAVERGEVKLIARSRGQYPGIKLPKGALPGLRTIGYWDAVGSQSWGLPMHRNEGIEICYVLSGETSFATDSGEWTLRAGDITITRPWQRHRLGDPRIRPCKLFWMILDVDTTDERSAWEFPDWIGPDLPSRRELLRSFRKNQCCHLVDSEGQLASFMQQTCEKLPDEHPLTTAYLANTINTLLLAIAERLSSGMDTNQQDPQGLDHTIRQFFHGLEASIDKSAEDWNVGEMAHACRVGKSYLTAACRKIFNTTPAEQLNRIRLNHARDLLVNAPEQSVTDIAFQVGFNTSQYFANRFKKQFGRTPQAYRNEQAK
ncbi:helix-turn-helix domain-containing protein [Coraliomargarita akajimensis]|uniref:Transcriptional regulator, AraC family n=1 Tax=Coraliomargarita akajimensis (strain DSM 45221 / IAM 15411 / JCM 23193 / KCTC 12865 / 04OKA010-24) TaxID=583355 RepID=D5EQZ9_CORAD|nr:helix-turn-helix domain-containing protein [Coraliomargarita akajimensis]ADE53992.1 transcriptional regulator, AraC family [Coraliomargarita akajimensis DSM 45221]